jgi:hypothetical protein
MSVSGNEITFTGVNLQMLDGSGATDSALGLGNLLAGYNLDSDDTRTGSDNLVAGVGHTFTPSSTIISGFNNEVSGALRSRLRRGPKRGERGERPL